MNIEPIGEKRFIDSLRKSQALWVAWHDRSVLVVPASESGNAIYTWSERDKAEAFIPTIIEHDCRPVEVPLRTFCELWLSNEAMNIQEILADPAPELSEFLTFSRSEFLSSLGST